MAPGPHPGFKATASGAEDATIRALSDRRFHVAGDGINLNQFLNNM
jgi:hypothetical protein